MTLDGFWTIINEAEFPRDWRYGQAVFNLLAANRPDLSEQIRGTGLDTFYVSDPMDSRMAEFTQWLAENW